MKKVFLLCVLLVFVSSLLAAGPTILFGTDATNPPMETLDSAQNFQGFDIDVVNAAGRIGGFQPKFVSVEWDEIFAGVMAGKYDAVLSSVTITSDRLKSMDFTVPYLLVGQVVIVRSSAKPVNAFADLSGKIVGVLSGSASETELRKAAPANKITPRKYDDLSPMFVDLVGGQIDGFFCDDYYAAGAVKSKDPMYKDKIKVAGPALLQEKYGIAVKKGNKKVLDLLNSALGKLMASAEYATIKAKWLK